MIGRALIERLSDPGVQLRLAVRDAARVKEHLPQIGKLKNVEVREHDFLQNDSSNLTTLVSGCDTIIHLAGLVHQPDQPPSMYDILNSKATKHLAEVARTEGVRKFVFTSTIAVYGPPPLDNVEEHGPIRPDTDYGRSKYQCEENLATTQPCPYVIALRPALVYGPGDRGNMLSLIRQVLKKRYFHIGSGDAKKSLIYSDDLARAILLALEKSPPGFQLYNVANPEQPTVREIADTIALAGCPGSRVPAIPEIIVRTGSYASLVLGGFSPLPPSRLDKLTRSSTCSVAKLQNLTGFAPNYTLLDGLNCEIEWASSAGKLATIRR